MPFSPVNVLARLIEDRETDIRLRRARTLDLLASRGRCKSTTNSDLRWNIILRDSNTSTTSMSTPGGAQTVGQTVQANLSFGQYKIYHHFAINRVDMVEAAARGTESIRELFRTHVDAGILAIRKKINEYIWTASAADATTYGGFIGMVDILDSSKSYAGLDPDDWPEWVAIVDTDTSPRNLTKTLLNRMETKMELEEVGYDTIVMHPNTALKYRELFESLAGVNQVVVDGSRADFYGGTLSWMGTPILIDRFCPAGQIVFFDSQYVELLSFDLANSDRNQLSNMGLKDNFSTIDSALVGGLRVNVALIPQTNPGTIEFQIFVIPQMRVSNRRMVQGLLNLNT